MKQDDAYVKESVQCKCAAGSTERVIPDATGLLRDAFAYRRVLRDICREQARSEQIARRRETNGREVHANPNASQPLRISSTRLARLRREISGRNAQRIRLRARRLQRRFHLRETCRRRRTRCAHSCDAVVQAPMERCELSEILGAKPRSAEAQSLAPLDLRLVCLISRTARTACSGRPCVKATARVPSLHSQTAESRTSRSGHSAKRRPSLITWAFRTPRNLSPLGFAWHQRLP